jgi:hypothetical protein
MLHFCKPSSISFAAKTFAFYYSILLGPALLFFGLYAKISTLKQRVDFYSLSFFATQLSFYGIIVWRFFMPHACFALQTAQRSLLQV